MARYQKVGLELTVLSDSISNVLPELQDFAANHNQDFVLELEAANAGSVKVAVDPIVTLSDTPTGADRENAIESTAITDTSVDVSLTGDSYGDIRIDKLSTRPGDSIAAVGRGFGRALVKKTNTALLTEAVTNGTRGVETPGALNELSGAQVWSSLVDAVIEIEEAEMDPTQFVLYVKSAAWSALIKNEASLRASGNPKEQAATLLGVSKVVTTPIPTVTVEGSPVVPVAVFAHVSGIVTPRRLTDASLTEGKIDNSVFARIRFGSKVLQAKAVQVVVEGEAPVTPEDPEDPEEE